MQFDGLRACAHNISKGGEGVVPRATGAGACMLHVLNTTKMLPTMSLSLSTQCGQKKAYYNHCSRIICEDRE